jgi:TolB-like protein/DNA-binding winged helix-turn-helix (wHTH) protein/tetratricopeptide (TPR) repeat protein
MTLDRAVEPQDDPSGTSASPQTPKAGLAGIFWVGRWRVEAARNRIATEEGEERRLEPQLALLLCFFAARQGEVVSKDEILDAVWGTRFVADSALTRAVAELRRSLGDEARNPSYIETIPKRGYRMLAEVRVDPVSIPGRAWPRRLLIAPLLVASIAVALWLSDRSPIPSSPAMRAASVTRRIAVLPLVDLSDADGQEYFADAMTDALTTVLARLPSLSVTSRRSVERYRDSEASSLEIAQNLGVEMLLQGTILRDASRVRFSVQLIDPLKDSHLWARSYERELGDVVSLQGEIVSAIAREVRVSLGPDTQRDLAGRAVDPTAHDLYLRGRHLLNSGKSVSQAPELFREALGIDPTYAPAWSGIADYFLRMSSLDPVAAMTGYPKAKEAAIEALALDPYLAEAHASLGTAVFLHDWDWERAERHFLRALELNPSDAGVRRQFAFFLTCQGRFDEAISHSKEAVLLDPLTADQRTDLGWIYWNAGRYEESLRTLSEHPAALPGRGVSRIYVAWNHALVGRYEEAIGTLDSDDLRDLATPQGASLGWSLARAGRRAEAEALLKQVETSVVENGSDPYVAAIIAAGLGDIPTAMRWLERGFEQHSPNMIHVKVEPFFAPLRDATAYQQLVERMAL